MKKLNGEEERKLAATTVRNTKPSEKKVSLSDGFGLSLEIHPNGAKYWRYNYRFAGKQKTLALGVYPGISLSDARKAHRDAYNMLAEGKDPSTERINEKLEQKRDAANTFAIVSNEWLTAKIINKKSESHEKRCIGLLTNHINPLIGNRPIVQLQKIEIVEPLKRMQAAGNTVSAHKARQVIAQVFNYASACGYINNLQKLDLLDGISGVLDAIDKNKNFAAITSPDALAEVLRLIDGSHATIVTKTALQLTPMLFQRPAELAGMKWEELNLDEGVWEIPAERMKLKRPHIVPLPRQAITLLEALYPVTNRSQFVFPNARSGKRHMTPEAILNAIRALGIDKETTTTHGFRATARTLLAEVKELGFPADIIEHQLAHEVKDPLGRAYNRTQFLEQRAEMMQAWADYLDKIKRG